MKETTIRIKKIKRVSLIFLSNIKETKLVKNAIKTIGNELLNSRDPSATLIAERKIAGTKRTPASKKYHTKDKTIFRLNNFITYDYYTGFYTVS